MTEISIIILLLGLIIECFNTMKLKFRINELEETVASHWSAVGHECSAIWQNINGEEEDYEEEEDEVDGDAEPTEM